MATKGERGVTFSAEDGHPRHPLMLAYSTPREPFNEGKRKVQEL